MPTDRARRSAGSGSFCEALFGVRGAWSYMHSFEGFDLRALQASSELAPPTPQVVIDQDGLRVTSVAVPQGNRCNACSRV